MGFFITAIILGLCYALMGLGIYISMKIFKIPDITTDGSFTLGAALTAVCLTQWQLQPLATLMVVIIGGAIAGSLTAIIHHYFKIEALLAGILVMTALYSINLMVMNRSNIPLINTPNIFKSLRFDLSEPYIVAILFPALFIAVLAIIFRTDFGIAIRASGDNETMSKSMGIKIGKMKIIGLAMANALTAVAGYLITQYQSFADINMGLGIVMVGLGSVLIGDSIANAFKVQTIAGKMIFVVFGSIIFQMILAISLSIGVNPNALKLITAVLVFAAVVLTNRKKYLSRAR